MIILSKEIKRLEGCIDGWLQTVPSLDYFKKNREAFFQCSEAIKNVKNGKELCELLESNDFPIPNIVIINQLIKLFGQARQYSLAKKMYAFALKVELVNLVTYNTMIGIAGKNKEIAFAKEVLNEMGVHGVHPDLITYNSLLDAADKCGDLILAEEIFKKAEEAESKGEIYLDVITYNSLINALGKRGTIDHVRIVLEKMDSKGILPDEVTYSILMKMAEKCENLDALAFAEEILRKKEVQGISLNIFDAAIFIYIAARCKNLARAKGMFDAAKKAGFPLDESVYNAILDAYWLNGEIDHRGVKAIFKESPFYPLNDLPTSEIKLNLHRCSYGSAYLALQHALNQALTLECPVIFFEINTGEGSHSRTFDRKLHPVKQALEEFQKKIKIQGRIELLISESYRIKFKFYPELALNLGKASVELTSDPVEKSITEKPPKPILPIPKRAEEEWQVVKKKNSRHTEPAPDGPQEDSSNKPIKRQHQRKRKVAKEEQVFDCQSYAEALVRTALSDYQPLNETDRKEVIRLLQEVLIKNSIQKALLPGQETALKAFMQDNVYKEFSIRTLFCRGQYRIQFAPSLEAIAQILSSSTQHKENLLTAK